MPKTIRWFLLSALSLIFLTQITACQTTPPAILRLATTTSTEDSGLLDTILPLFEQEYNARVDVIAVGTGQALTLGQNGDADLILVHARDREDQFVAEGYGLSRHDVMYNDFVIIGPANDPANIRSAPDLSTAFQRIATTQSTFISRGDDSGTHIREQTLWQQADITPADGWYLAIGQGMGATLTIADEQQAYTLTDRGTFIKRQTIGLTLPILYQNDPALVNPYGIIPINPQRHAVNSQLAQQFITWLTSPPIQQQIDNYTINGQQLFYSNSQGACPPACFRHAPPNNTSHS
ncbi:MAG TPA: substrate-binding domain-containing protein [Anaerolineae bacterium]|nr:substrate-binding domain-containing protein [Anaerolineae bacterium]